MSNLIQYIIQEDPEKEMKKKTYDKQTYTSYTPNQNTRKESDKTTPQNLLETVLSSNQSNQTPTPCAKKQSKNLLERINSSNTVASQRLKHNTSKLRFWRRN